MDKNNSKIDPSIIQSISKILVEIIEDNTKENKRCIYISY